VRRVDGNPHYRPYRPERGEPNPGDEPALHCRPRQASQRLRHDGDDDGLDSIEDTGGLGSLPMRT
jgi:hypothetical protein